MTHKHKTLSTQKGRYIWRSGIPNFTEWKQLQSLTVRWVSFSLTREGGTVSVYVLLGQCPCVPKEAFWLPAVCAWRTLESPQKAHRSSALPNQPPPLCPSHSTYLCALGPPRVNCTQSSALVLKGLRERVPYKGSHSPQGKKARAEQGVFIDPCLPLSHPQSSERESNFPVFIPTPHQQQIIITY